MFFVFLIILLMLFGITWFIARSLHSGLSVVVPKVKRWHVLTAVAALNGVMLVGFMRSMLPLPAAVKVVFGTVGMYWMGFAVYLLLFLLLAQAVLLVLRFTPLKTYDKRRFYAVAAAVLLSLSTAVYGCVHACRTETVSYEITLDDGKNAPAMTLVSLSDLHLGALGSEARLEKLVDRVNDLKPDVVCITGDLFDSDFNAIRHPDRVAEQLRSLRATYGVYACLGNHDAGDTFSQMLAFLPTCGITLLAEEATVIDDRLVLIGRLDGFPIGDSGDKTRGELSAFWTPTDPALPVVVMDHNPAHIGEYGNDVDLILSGHTHKGQLFPAELITNAMFETDYGYYRRDNHHPQVIVSSGVGTWGMPMRVGTNSEIVHVTFR